MAIDRGRLLDKMNELQRKHDEFIEAAGLGEYHEIWQDVSSRLDFRERWEFSLFIQLMDIANDYHKLKTEFPELWEYKRRHTDQIPPDERVFLQVFVEEEQWNCTINELGIKDDAHYFKILNQSSDYLKELISGEASESDIMKTVKRVYKSTEYTQLFAELAERYSKARSRIPGEGPYRSIIVKHLEFMKGENLRKEQIMKPENYDRMIGYVDEYFTKQDILVSIKPIPKINLSDHDTWYPFSLIWKEINPKMKSYPKDLFLFLMKLFDQLPDPKKYESEHDYKKTTLYVKFGTKSPNYKDLTGKIS